MTASIFTISGILGLILISVAIWLRDESKQDIMFIVGGIFLLVYSISIKSVIFIVLQVVFIVSALAELFRLRKTGGGRG